MNQHEDRKVSERTEQGFALAARRFAFEELGLLSFHSTRDQAVREMNESSDTRSLSVVPATVRFAANGNVRLWRTLGEPVAERKLTQAVELPRTTIECSILAENHGAEAGSIEIEGEVTPRAVIAGMIDLAKRRTAFVDFTLEGVSQQAAWTSNVETLLALHEQGKSQEMPENSTVLDAAGGKNNGSARFQVGTIVGAHRWPYHSAHPECWGTPWKGVVLALNDPRAWAGNLALSTQQKIDEHVAWCHDHGLLKDTVPVLWDFGDEKIVYFQSASNDARCHDLRPYAEDYLDWQTERAAALRRVETERATACEPCI
ncbi:hypothetical protein [Burkholderia gladioli]|uniref:hypothetical protein n=1 Tax=Burkholderia gladioli TaxID=28095 RepID=UPI00163EC1BD|nr:hypothetical protein [Burkholderia gladioli]